MGTRGGPGTSDPGQINMNYVTLRDLLIRAYSVQEFQIAGPSWLSNERYDIAAKVPVGTSKEQSLVILQNLLIERFHLQLHRETKEVPIYELVVAKNGPKFKESPSETVSAAAPAPDLANANEPLRLKTGPDGVVELPFSMQGKGHIAIRSFRGTEMRVRRESLDYLLERLIAVLQRPVINKTGLTGQYDYTLAYSPQNMTANTAGGVAESRPPAAAIADDRPPDLFTALERQLGLKLESKKAPGEVLIVDRVEKTPTDN